MMRIIEYIYYRVNHLFRKFSGPDKSFCHHNTIAYLCVCLIMNISAVVFIISYLIFDVSSKEVMAFMTNGHGFPWPIILIVIVTWCFFSSFLSDRGSFYYRLDKKYKNDKYRTVKGWLIVGYTIFTVLFPFLGLTFEKYSI